VYSKYRSLLGKKRFIGFIKQNLTKVVRGSDDCCLQMWEGITGSDVISVRHNRLPGISSWRNKDVH